MKLLLKSATIVDASSKHHLKKQDVLIENGKISKIASNIPSSEKVKEVTLKNLHISQGWFDSSVSFGEPGFEERETIENGLKTAALSGFTSVAVNANSFPVTDSKGHIKFLKSKAEGNALNLYPVGALTVGSKGTDLAELYDMKNEGAVSFYDYKIPIANPNLLKIALQYTQNFDGLVQSFPFEKSVARNGIVNEEVNSTRLGLKGIPALSEELQIIRDLYILEYTGGKLHIPTISTKKSVELIKDAKKKGLNVTCSVAIFNLILTDDVLEGFDTIYKLLPPLRTKEDIKALLKGLKEGTIDGVTSDHNPIDVEHKKTEFEHALFGSIGLESCFGALNLLLGVEESVKALTGLKEVFNITSEKIEEGNLAELTLFNPYESWEFSEKDIVSTSKNAALLGVNLKGKPYGIIANNQLELNK
ncbi:dihydroorotase-like cyclic amidohydrolase [Aequorivita sublithincola DSM 14238]|uniref:Dihydroorotase-like cyclic amidohydrolase n=1 Tax=Aequorivita sublithincola (strain DSM 14238 / LMG 21431 / ACAM 643 / 9-3) TaxID=746697 RepID=I3YZ26_AEQSU|nr:dihydroorotase [Aequorivita sublithincola]AFL82244.1 dihydroorotase-like cyclic amidohydrolase [Aequorivita sublithincola DSM 14238]